MTFFPRYVAKHGASESEQLETSEDDVLEASIAKAHTCAPPNVDIHPSQKDTDEGDTVCQPLCCSLTQSDVVVNSLLCPRGDWKSSGAAKTLNARRLWSLRLRMTLGGGVHSVCEQGRPRKHRRGQKQQTCMSLLRLCDCVILVLYCLTLSVFVCL